MKISTHAIIGFSRPVVYSAYRDELPALVGYLPNIRRIEAKERREEGGVVYLVNEWHGGGEIPAVARAFLSESMLTWTDYAEWEQDRWLTRWRVEPHAFPGAVRSEGENRYVELGDGTTRLEIEGELTVDASKIPGVPRLLAGKVSRGVETHLVKLVEGNLVEVCKGLERYLRDKGA